MIKEDVIKNIVSLCRQGVKEITQQDIKELKVQLGILQKIVSTHEEEQQEKSAEYWNKAKLGTSYFFRSISEDGIGSSYTAALEAITKILDILRGEPLTITIQKVQRDSSGNIIGITTYTGREQDLTTRFNSKYNQVEYDLNASLNALKKTESTNLAVIQHYANFYNIANEHIKSTRSSASRTGWKKRVNEGNIVEAYQRHLKMKHMSEDLTPDSVYDDFSVPEVMILLYYSVGNTPWWQQGDIGYNQIKAANNAKLASATSIRRVAAKILQIFSQENEFDIKEFNEMFTAQDQDQLTDISKLNNSEINNLLKEVKATGKFKNVVNIIE